MKRKSKSFIYPVVLMLFILCILFIFFFGENGLLVHKEKLERIRLLHVENKGLYDRVYELNRKLILLKDSSPFYLEEEARDIALKREGDIIISLFNGDVISDFVSEHEEFYGLEFMGGVDSFEEVYVSYHGEILLGLFLNILIAFVLTIVVPFGEGGGETVMRGNGNGRKQ